jgi:hypothetical protein
MKINIINYEISNPWILSKISQKLYENLIVLGHEVTLSNKVDYSADINHHVTFHSYKEEIDTINTLMITHIDNIVKLNKLKDDLKTAKIGICMSKSTMEELIELGIPKSQLDYALCAHDDNYLHKKVSLGFTTRLYADGRKNEDFFIENLKNMSPNDFKFEIMGFGWLPYVKKLQSLGFEVKYFEEFDYDQYKKLFTRIDYYIYLGSDEGSMGFIDALAAGVKTIVQPQGFHLDAINGITYSFKSSSEYSNIMAEIIKEKHRLQKSVEDWTWINYAKKHLEIWERCFDLQINNDDKSEFNVKNIKTKIRLTYNYFKQKTTLIINLRHRKGFPAGPRFFGPDKNKNN